MPAELTQPAPPRTHFARLCGYAGPKELKHFTNSLSGKVIAEHQSNVESIRDAVSTIKNARECAPINHLRTGDAEVAVRLIRTSLTQTRQKEAVKRVQLYGHLCGLPPSLQEIAADCVVDLTQSVLADEVHRIRSRAGACHRIYGSGEWQTHVSAACHHCREHLGRLHVEVQTVLCNLESKGKLASIQQLHLQLKELPIDGWALRAVRLEYDKIIRPRTHVAKAKAINTAELRALDARIAQSEFRDALAQTQALLSMQPRRVTALVFARMRTMHPLRFDRMQALFESLDSRTLDGDESQSIRDDLAVLAEVLEEVLNDPQRFE